MADTIETLAARLTAQETSVSALTAELDQAKAELAAMKEAATPPPQTHVYCTDCMTEIPIGDAENWPDPDQGGAKRYRCKLRTPCKARIKEAEEHAERMRQEAEARQRAASEALIEEAKRRLREEAGSEGAR